MSCDDDRIGFLAGDEPGALDNAERAELEELKALLSDPSLWAEPADGLEDAVVAAIAEESGATTRPTARARPSGDRRRRARVLSFVGAAAAAVVLAAVVVTVAGGDDPDTVQLAAALDGTELVPGASGRATLTETESGWRIELDVTGLPRLDDGRFYQAWLRNDAGVLVAVGTFNEGDDVVLWAGVSPEEFSTITVTEETVGDGPDSSGRRVLVGEVATT